MKAFNAILLALVIVLSAYLLTLGKEGISSAAMNIGYIGIFVFSFFLDVSFQIISPNIFLISGIIGGINPYYLTLNVILASTLAGIAAYYLGITHSEAMLHSVMSEKRAKKAIEYFKKYGKWGMAILALSPIPYLPILAGIFKMKIKDFAIYALLMRAIHFIIIALLIMAIL